MYFIVVIALLSYTMCHWLDFSYSFLDKSVILTLFKLGNPFGVLCKQCKSSSDAAKYMYGI